MAKKSTKSKEQTPFLNKEVTNEKVNPTPPVNAVKEQKYELSPQDYIFRKLKVFAKHKQVAVVELNHLIDPVRCAICKNIVFYAGNVSYIHEVDEKLVTFHNICPKCLTQTGVKFIPFADRIALVKLAFKEIFPGMLNEVKEQCKCDLCHEKRNGYTYWTYYADMPWKLFICQSCESLVPKKTKFSNANAPINAEPTGDERSISKLGDLDDFRKELN